MTAPKAKKPRAKKAAPASMQGTEPEITAAIEPTALAETEAAPVVAPEEPAVLVETAAAEPREEEESNPEEPGEEGDNFTDLDLDDDDAEDEDDSELRDDDDEDEEEDEDEETGNSPFEDDAEDLDEEDVSEEAPDPEEEEDDAGEDGVEDSDFKAKPRPPAKLERLQKILAAAGVASRRKAEEMIEQGRVQVNGKTVTELGTKADMGRDHIRVDGKLLQGAERLRYYMLNKPKGFVTTVKDPEGRPTVMQFFEKMKERLYPVGRLDYMSEGLLLVTNDGELANRLTKASSGVEKTYLVKVAGQPTEDELDLLRTGVSIERGKAGEGRVKTAPARIRQVRQGDNPWFEVVLIEGRNRELRKMFEEVGHFVEKIRRIGYGPLVLDQEPGSLRELDAEELEQLRKAADGKLRTPKAKDLRRRNLLDAQLPTIQPRSNLPRQAQPDTRTSGTGAGYRPRPSAPPREGFRSARPAASGEGFRPAAGRPFNGPPASANDRSDDRPRRPGTPGQSRFGSGSGSGYGVGRPTGRPSARPAWQKSAPPPARFAEGREDRPAAPRSFEDRPPAARTSGDRPAAKSFGAPPAGRPFPNKPASRSFGDKPERKTWSKPQSNDREAFKRPALSTRADDDYSDLEPRKNIKLHIEPMQDDRSAQASGPRATGARPYAGRPSAPRPSSDRPRADRPAPSRFNANRSKPGSSPDNAASDRPSGGRSFSSEGGMPRRFTTSSGQPRAGGARPSSKPGRPSGPSSRPYGAGGGASRGPRPGGSDSRPGFSQRPPAFRRDSGEGSSAPRTPRPFTPREGGASEFRPRSPKPFTGSAGTGSRTEGGEKRSGWKPRPSFGGGSGGVKPAGGGRPKAGGFSKPGGSGYKGKPGGSRPASKRPGGAPGGKRRG
jgi:23S rRNA pseudouridine2605 synthase